MLSFLYCDLGNIKNNKEYFNKYIKMKNQKYFEINFSN